MYDLMYDLYSTIFDLHLSTLYNFYSIIMPHAWHSSSSGDHRLAMAYLVFFIIFVLSANLMNSSSGQIWTVNSCNLCKGYSSRHFPEIGTVNRITLSLCPGRSRGLPWWSCLYTSPPGVCCCSPDILASSISSCTSCRSPVHKFISIQFKIVYCTKNTNLNIQPTLQFRITIISKQRNWKY